MSHSSNATEDGALIEIMRVRSKAVYDIVIIPYVNLRYFTISCCERLCAVPFDVIVEIMLVTCFTKLHWEKMFLPLARIIHVAPGLQRTRNAYAIVIDLITAADHDMYGIAVMDSKHIVPQRASRPGIFIGANRESITAVKHNAHGLMSRRYVENPGRHTAGTCARDIAEVWYGVLPLDALC